MASNNIHPRKFALCAALSTLLLPVISFAQAPENILASSEKFKPTVTYSDTYSEKTITIPGEKPDPATHDKVANPQKISAKVVADITGFDFTEVGDDLEVGLSVGGFSLSGLTLSQSLEAAKTGSFPANGKKATFLFTGTFEKPNGDTIDKTVGSAVFAWTPTRLTVTITCSDIASTADVTEINASEFLELYVDESELGNKPSGTVKFDNHPTDVTVSFGTAVGNRLAYGKGQSTTKYVKFGSDAKGTLEEIYLQSATVAGAADVTAPKITANVPAKDTDDGYISFLISVNDTPVVNSLSEIPAPFVQITVTGPNPDEENFLDVEASEIPEVTGAVKYDVSDLALFEGKNTVVITATDASGNATVVKKTVTVTLPAEPVFE